MKKATLSKVELKERKPLSDVCQIIQSPVKNVIEETVEKADIKHIDSSYGYSPMSIDLDKSIQGSNLSLTANRLSSDIDTYTCELYSYLRDVEVGTL